MDFFLNFFINIGMFIILAQSYNLVLGYTGLVHLGHIAFMAIGAYTSVLLSLSGFPFVFSALAGILLAGIIGLILAIPTVKVKEDYLVVVTLGLGEITRSVLINWRSLTEGALGLTKIPRPNLFGFTIDTHLEYFVFVLIITILINFFVYRLVKSPFGRVLETIREDQTAALTLGKNIWKYKIVILVVGASIAGLAGIIDAHFVNYIDPFIYNINRMVFVLLMVVFGGAGNFWGPIVGTLILYSIFELIRFVPLPDAILGALRWSIYAFALVVMMIFKPTGILGKKLLRKKY